jgi:DNA-binding NtrC family response regulator
MSDSINEKRPGRILIIDDEADIRESLETLLQLEGYQVDLAANADQGELRLTKLPYDLVLLDQMMPGRTGMELLQSLRAQGIDTPIFMLTAFGSVDIAVQALKSGANDYFPKPWDNTKLLIEIDRMIAKQRLEEENLRLRRAFRERFSFRNLVFKSERMVRLAEVLEQAAPTKTSILITGEVGTGKEFIAKAVHANSPRRDGPFVAVNCSGVSAEVLDGLIFGARGHLESAAGGSLFLDEVTALHRESQAKLLRQIQDRSVDARLIVGSVQEIRRLVEEGKFREDLYYRLSVIHAQVPALRDRKEDIVLLVKHFLDRHCKDMEKFVDGDGHSILTFEPDAMRILMEHSWPGNVGELENVIERAVVLATGDSLSTDLLPEYLLHAGGVWTRRESVAELPGDASLHERVNEFERRAIVAALEECGGSQTDAAERLKVPLSTLNQKIKRLNVVFRKL